MWKGYLQKESLYLKMLRKRWIVLKDNKLFSYKSRLDDKETEIIDLKLCQKVEVVKREKSRNKPLVLVFRKNKRRVLAAVSEQDRNRWVKCLQSVIHSQHASYNIDDNRQDTEHKGSLHSVYMTENSTR